MTHFRLQSVRFDFVARGAIHFPRGRTANLLRGAFGATVYRTADGAHYRSMFAPVSAGGPSGLANPPRPFAFRARHLEGESVPDGGRFHFDLNWFDNHGAAPDRIDLEHAELLGVSATPVVLDLEPGGELAERVVVRFLTPVELKAGGELADRPEFGILAARIRDRLSTLRALYGAGPLEIDFRGFAARAARVRMTRCEIRHRDLERQSRRTGQVHPMGGFVGEAEYEGALAEFVPYLEAARWTGVGRHTAWGNGEIGLDLDGPTPHQDAL